MRLLRLGLPRRLLGLQGELGLLLLLAQELLVPFLGLKRADGSPILAIYFKRIEFIRLENFWQHLFCSMLSTCATIGNIDDIGILKMLSHLFTF